MLQLLLTLSILATPPADGATKQTEPVDASDLSSAMKADARPSWGPAKHYDRFARLFVENGRRWGVDPVLVACIAYAESRYHIKPPRLWVTRCKTRLVGCDRPGPCNPRRVKTCKPVHLNTEEAGMMQVLWHDRSTREGYRLCTGRKLTGKRTVRQDKLSAPEVSVCVGAYELARWKRWAYRGGYGRIRCGRRGGVCRNRLTPRRKRNRAFFTRHPDLAGIFWSSFYNWGSNKWVGNGYARKVAWCYRRYTKRIGATRKARSIPLSRSSLERRAMVSSGQVQRR